GREFSTPLWTPPAWLPLMIPRKCLMLLVVSLALPAPGAYCCNVPVFRYALERWPADEYQVVVFHRGPLTEADQKAIAVLKGYEGGGKKPANLQLQVVDLDKPRQESYQALWKNQKEPVLPWMAVLHPDDKDRDQAFWAGRLDADTCNRLGDSPGRR